MVRFARAEGSKGSNKRQLEEPTPWVEMKEQMVAEGKEVSVVKRKKKQKKQNGDVEILENSNTSGDPPNTDSKVEDLTDADSKVPQNRSVKDPNPDNEENQIENGSQEKALSKREKKKLKLAKKNEEGESKPEFIVNDKGQRVKVFKDGKERIYFDLPYEEGERMSRFEGFWVKKEMIEKLELLKTSLKTEGTEEQEIRKKMMKMKRKAHSELRRELVLEQKALLQENQKEGSQLNKKDTETKTNDGASKLKKSKKKSDKMKTKKPQINGSLETGIEVSELCEDALGQDELLQKDCVKVSKVVPHESFAQEDGKKEENYKPYAREKKNWVSREKEFIPLKYEENNIMTDYEGYWVRRSAVPKLHAVKQSKIKKLKELRSDGSQDDLTPEEQHKLTREMKKEKRNEHRKLNLLLIHEGQKNFNRDGRRNMYNNRETPRRPGKPGRSLGINYTEQRGDMVKFDGFWVKSDSAERLKQLKERLTSEGLPKEEIDAIMKRERRKEERVLKNEKKLVCFKCRQPGHFVSSCPTVLNQGVPYSSEGNDLCYKCGSTEHMSRQCTVKRKGSEFSHAVCFICRESGHIAKECPDNPRGLYPKGGACKQCGSVEHLRKDCPELQAENEKNTLKAETMDSRAIDALDTFDNQNLSTNFGHSPVKKRKIIKF